jgi:hypothetical protein
MVRGIVGPILRLQTDNQNQETGGSMRENNGRFAVVTGASSGIGYELARVFAKNSYDLLVTAENDLSEAVRELESLGTQVQSVQADLAKYEGVEKLWAAIQSTGRQVDAIAISRRARRREGYFRCGERQNRRWSPRGLSGRDSSAGGLRCSWVSSWWSLFRVASRGLDGATCRV